MLYTAHTVQKRNLVERKSLIGPWGEGELKGVGVYTTTYIIQFTPARSKTSYMYFKEKL